MEKYGIITLCLIVAWVKCDCISSYSLDIQGVYNSSYCCKILPIISVSCEVEYQ